MIEPTRIFTHTDGEYWVYVHPRYHSPEGGVLPGVFRCSVQRHAPVTTTVARSWSKDERDGDRLHIAAKTPEGAAEQVERMINAGQLRLRVWSDFMTGPAR